MQHAWSPLRRVPAADPTHQIERPMGLFGNMYDKRKAKIDASAQPFLGAGEVAGASAICQPEKQAMRALFGGKHYEQYLVTATDENLYVFPISPIKNEVFGDHVETRPIGPLDAEMDGRRGVIGDFHLAPLRVAQEIEDLVAFVQQHHAA
jgi:hypothetical protein